MVPTLCYQVGFILVCCEVNSDITLCFRDDHEAALSLGLLPHNGSTITVNTQLSDSSQQLFRSGNVTIGGSYEGCLDQLIINQHQVSLLSPLDVSTEFATCDPRPPSESAREFGNGVWLYGAQSYVGLTLQQVPSSQFQIQFQFRTLDASGLLLFYPRTDTVQYLALYLLEGRVRVDCRLSTLDVISLDSESFYNTGLWYSIILSLDGLNVTVVINDTEMLSGSSSVIVETDATFSPSQVLLLGGLSSEYADVENLLNTASSIAGCIRNLQIGSSVVNLQDAETFFRADFGGCPEAVAPGVRFMGNGRAEFSMGSQQLHNITFAFRTTQLAALLLHVGGLSVRIFHTKLRVDIDNHFILTSEESGFNDNTRHTVFLLYSSSGNLSK